MIQPFTLITGSSSGIGQGIALRLAAGRALLLGGRDHTRMAQTLSQCQNSRGSHVLWQYDLSNTHGIADSLGGLMRQQDAVVDTFIHCAGVVSVMPMRLMEPALAEEIMAVNFFSAAEIVRTLLQRSINQGTLRQIVFISSSYGIRGAKGQAIYSASKGALDAMMRSLAVELAPKVRVNSVVPGAVRTPMSQAGLACEEYRRELKRQHLLGIGEVDDIARTVEFLVSDAARWITGQQFVVDGGQTAH